MESPEMQHISMGDFSTVFLSLKKQMQEKGGVKNKRDGLLFHDRAGHGPLFVPKRHK